MRHGNTYELPSGTPVQLGRLSERDQWLIENAKRRAAAQGRPVYTGF